VNDDADLVRLVDTLEDACDGYVSLEQVERAVGADVSAQIASGLLLVDHRTKLDGSDVIVCRLNRHHPLVAQLTSW
jgi:hypothetical protein